MQCVSLSEPTVFGTDTHSPKLPPLLPATISKVGSQCFRSERFFTAWQHEKHSMTAWETQHDSTGSAGGAATTSPASLFLLCNLFDQRCVSADQLDERLIGRMRAPLYCSSVVASSQFTVP